VGFTRELFDDSSSSSSVDPAAQAAMISAMAEAYRYIAEIATVVAQQEGIVVTDYRALQQVWSRADTGRSAASGTADSR